MSTLFEEMRQDMKRRRESYDRWFAVVFWIWLIGTIGGFGMIVAGAVLAFHLWW